MSSRPRVALGCALAALLVLTAGTAGVVWLLDRTVTVRIADSCSVTIDDTSRSLDADQADNAALIAAIAVRRELPARAVTIGLATAIQESRLRNIDYGDRDSLGLFQQRPSQGWGTPEQIMDPVYSTATFYDALVLVPGYEEMEITVAAQTVQRSGFPDAYAQHEAVSRHFASALTGHSPGALTCRLPMPPEAPEGAGPAADAVLARLERDFGELDVRVEDGSVIVSAASVAGGDPDRLAWALAHWAVASATDTGATRVEVAGQMWQRSHGNSAAWSDLRDDEGAPGGANGLELAADEVRIS